MSQGHPPHGGPHGGHYSGPGGHEQGHVPYGQSQVTNQYPPGYVPPPQYSTPGSSVAALVLGLMGMFMCGCVAGIPAIFVGHSALGTHRAQPHLPGRGLAVAGCVLGYISSGLTLLGVLVYMLLAVGAVLLS